MPEGFVSRKAKEAQLYPKSSGESANNENQIITPFKWENNADKTEVIVSLKDKYVFNISDLTTLLSSSAITSLLYRPPIGIPVFWFSSVPDWALAFDDGSGPYDWADYPELDNDGFKTMLTIWSNAGWMTAYNSTSFYVPDLKGLFPRISGTNAIRSTVYAGGNLANYLAHQFQQHQHYHRHGLGYDNDDHAHSPYNMVQGTDNRLYTYYTDYASANASSGNYGAETRPGSFSLRIIVRFE